MPLQLDIMGHKSGNTSPIERTLKEKVTPEQKQAIIKMYIDGTSISDLAKTTGFGKSTIYKWCQDAEQGQPTKEEPAPTAIGTSSDTKNKLYLDNSTAFKSCQALDSLKSATNTIDDLLDSMDFEDVNTSIAFQIGEISAHINSAVCSLKEGAK